MVVLKEKLRRPTRVSAPCFEFKCAYFPVTPSLQLIDTGCLEGSKWRLGIKQRMTKWLNPDATTADLGEGMQAYYDEKRKVWVFPGEDPDEKAKPVGPPPTFVSPQDKAPSSEEPATPADPLAAMMAPPKRSASFRRSSSISSVGSMSTTGRYPPGMMLPPGASRRGSGPPELSAAGPPPQFTVFKPAPTTTKEEENDQQDE